MEPSNEIHWHLGTFADIPVQSSQSPTFDNKYWQEAGELATRQVSSAYCMILTRWREPENWYPRSTLMEMVSTRVFITVLKMTTRLGTPPSAERQEESPNSQW